MQLSGFPFFVTDWSKIERTEHKGATGTSFSQASGPGVSVFFPAPTVPAPTNVQAVAGVVQALVVRDAADVVMGSPMLGRFQE